MPEAEAKTQAAIDSARLSGKRRVSGHVEKVRAGEAGRRIVLEAREIKAAAVVMALPRGAPGRPSLAERSRPCSSSGRAE